MAAFARCWNYGLINFDDYLYILTHRPLTSWQGWETLYVAFTDISEGIWMPLTWLSYLGDHLLFGDWYGGFHLTSIVLHAGNAALVFFFLRELFVREEEPPRRAHTEWLCLFAALLWAVHPLRCESVVLLSSRKDILSFFFELLALLSWVRGSRETSRSYEWTRRAMLFFVLGSCCKPSVMTFPVLCLLIDAFIMREVRIERYLIPTGYMLVFGVFAGWQQTGGGTIQSVFDDPLWYRLLNACAAFGIYVRNTVWPQWLALPCVKRWPEMPRFLVPGLVVCAVFGGALLWRARHYVGRWRDNLTFEQLNVTRACLRSRWPKDPVFAGALWFLLALGPMLGIARFGFHAFADRFTYIPAVGLSVALVGALQRVRWRGVCMALAGGVAALGCAAWWQTGFCHDDNALYSHALEVDGDQNACAHTNLGLWNFEIPHDVEAAVAHYRKAVELDIYFVFQTYDLYIIALLESGRAGEIPEAMRLFHEGIVRYFGEERAQKILQRAEGLTMCERQVMTIYLRAKTAWWLADAHGVSSAEEEFAKHSKGILEDHVWLYLQWRTAKLKGDEKAAVDFMQRLKNNKCIETYNRFRYLQQGDYVGLNWKRRERRCD